MYCKLLVVGPEQGLMTTHTCITLHETCHAKGHEKCKLISFCFTPSVHLEKLHVLEELTFAAKGF